MKKSPLHLPWTPENVPHAILDILRGCNIRCRDCYNLHPDHVKPLAEIDAQLDALMRLRKLQSISIVGGEPTLHPDLVEIVRRARQRGLFVELFTNGVDLNGPLLADLKRVGTNVIFLHIEANQRRPDLSAEAGEEDLRRLRMEKAALIAAHDIEVGLAVTAYPDKPAETEEAVRFALHSPHVCCLLVTWWRDVGRMPPIRGNLASGMFAQLSATRQLIRSEDLRTRESCQTLQATFGLHPFACLGSNLDATDPRWTSFMVGAVHQGEKLTFYHSLQPTWVERAFLGLSRLMTGRYPFYQPQHAGLFSLHLLLNGLAGGRLGGNLKLLAHVCRPGARLSAKRLLFQRPAAFDEQGRLVHCQPCPDAPVIDPVSRKPEELPFAAQRFHLPMDGQRFAVARHFPAIHHGVAAITAIDQGIYQQRVALPFQAAVPRRVSPILYLASF